jgi:hypothetical protein
MDLTAALPSGDESAVQRPRGFAPGRRTGGRVGLRTGRTPLSRSLIHGRIVVEPARDQGQGGLEHEAPPPVARRRCHYFADFHRGGIGLEWHTSQVERRTSVQ